MKPCLQQLHVCMQIELKYPPASERPTQAAGQAQPLSFRPGELPKQAAKLPQWAPEQARAFCLALGFLARMPRLQYRSRCHLEDIRMPLCILLLTCHLATNLGYAGQSCAGTGEYGASLC